MPYSGVGVIASRGKTASIHPEGILPEADTKRIEEDIENDRIRTEFDD